MSSHLRDNPSCPICHISMTIRSIDDIFGCKNHNFNVAYYFDEYYVSIGIADYLVEINFKLVNWQWQDVSIRAYDAVKDSVNSILHTRHWNVDPANLEEEIKNLLLFL